MRAALFLALLAWLALVPTAAAQQESCFGAYDFSACEQAHHDPGIAVLGGAVTVVSIATGVALVGPSLMPWAKGTDDSVPLDGEEEAEADPDMEDEPLVDPWDGRLLPMKKGDAWWQRSWLEEESAEEHVEDARRALQDRERQREDFARDGA